MLLIGTVIVYKLVTQHFLLIYVLFIINKLAVLLLSFLQKRNQISKVETVIEESI